MLLLTTELPENLWNNLQFPTSSKYDFTNDRKFSERNDNDTTFIFVPVKKSRSDTDLSRPWISQRLSSPIVRLIQKLQSLEQTPEDERWPRATWPTSQAFEDAHTFIRNLPLAKIPIPEVYLADDGEINFLWKSRNVHIDLGFYGTETFTYYARGKDGSEFFSEEIGVKSGLPTEIVQLFSD